MIRLRALIFCVGCLIFFFSSNLVAQDKCGTVAIDKIRHEKNPSLETTEQFEQWMSKKIIELGARTASAPTTQAITYNIPVVVHVIHNGEAVGSGTNIPDAQVVSQINVLNEDYQRLNADASNTPTEFQSVAGSISINFVLAKQDPEGLATNGITRTKGTKTAWALTDVTDLKALSYWPAEDYLNVWVANISGGIIGYAQLPISSSIGGLENPSQDRLTDGVLIDYLTFGRGSSFNLSSSFALGRTATHEIGHFLGLRHIWGDGSCATDYVDDTPAQTTSTSGCPTHPQASCETAHPDKMFQNYMDYSNDNCMNLFTKIQNSRMDVILQNSPRRLSLTTSHGLNAPASIPTDLGIRQIASPLSANCNTSITPQLEVRNYGSTTITAVKVQLTLNGTAVGGSPFSFPLSLTNLQSSVLSFPTMSFASSSTQQLAFQITQINNGAATDGNGGNDAASIQVVVPAVATLPILETFDTTPATWQISNPDGRITWANIQAPNGSATNRAMYIDFYDYEDEGPQDRLSSPSFSVSNALTSQLKFDISHAIFPGQTGDELRVYAVPGCSPDLSQGILLYDKSGSDLATVTSTSNAFSPTSASQWRTEAVSLNTLTVGAPYQIVFVSVNGYGNNLYVDNVVISDTNVNDIALDGISSPGLVECLSAPTVSFKVKNLSTVTINSFQLQVSLNGGTVTTQSLTNTNLSVGQESTFSFSTPLISGQNQIALTLLNPNGIADTAPANNALTFNVYFDASTDATPLRESFDSNLEVPWIIATPFNSTAWQSVTTSTKKQSVVFKSFSNATLNQESWLVSPVLDMSRYPTSTLLFDASYAVNTNSQSDNIKIIASDDCGLTYAYTLLDEPTSSWSITSTPTEWVPLNDSQWKRQYVSLTGLAGKKNVRIAFVATNQNGNNLYIDNIEIFAGTDSNPPISTSAYQIYYSAHTSESDLALTFNLAQKQDVHLQIYSLQGQIMVDNTLPETLNQTYYFDFATQAAGLYLFRLEIDHQVSTTKVFIRH